MTNFEQFQQNPWKQQNLHNIYERSFLHISPSPETVTGEILLASLYRSVGFKGFANEQVWKLGTPFDKRLESGKRFGVQNSTTGMKTDLWKNIVKRVIATPKLAGQSKQRREQISPIVPDATLYSMSARLTGNPWNPGKMIAKMIALGTGNQEEALAIWQAIFDKLSVDDLQDDIWARVLQSEFESWRSEELIDAWQRPTEFPLGRETFPTDFDVTIPAKNFVDDLNVVLGLKEKLTRRQWITMLESLCRIGASAHVMWLCNANDWCYKAMEDALDKGTKYSIDDVKTCLSMGRGFWSIGQPSGKAIKDTVRRYITGRCSINLLLHMLEDAGLDMAQVSLGSPFEITHTLNYLSAHREQFNFTRYLSQFSNVMEVDNRIADCKKGTSKNVLEFLEHVARQRITSEVGLESYDQGYYLKKNGAYASAPWVVGLGPLSVLLMVHCATERVTGPSNVQDLINQLAGYGIDATIQLGKRGSLNKLLREMSIAVDSPDAEGGMVISSPLTTLSGQNG